MTSPTTAASRTAIPAARLVAVVVLVATALAVALPLVTGGGWLLELFRTPEPVLAPSFALTGALLVGLAAARRLGWLLLAVAASAAAFVLATSWSLWTGDPVATWARSWTWVPALLLTVAVLPQVLPHGRALPGPWRWGAVAGVALTLATTVAVAVLSTSTEPVQPLSSPLVVVPLVVLLGLGAASLVVRVRRADGVQRRQLAWVAYGVATAVVATFVAPWWLVCVAVLAVPASLAVAAFRYRLYAIDVVVARTLLGAVLFVLTAVAYAAVVAWARALLGGRPELAAVLATFVVALAFHPVLVRVRRLVDRLVLGRRGDPYAVLTVVEEAVRGAPSPREALAAGAARTREALGLAAVHVEVPLPDGGTATVATGDAAPEHALRLRLHEEDVGVLRWSPGAGGRGADGRLLGDLARPLAATAYAVRLAEDVERSRRHAIGAAEEERRRLRRDLHDGLGPQLSAVVMTADTARSALRRGDTDRADRLVASARDQAAEAVQDVRRLVDGLRPPALDDLGLLGALRAATTGLRAPGGPEVVVTGDGEPTALPAAVEVAALRIALEAVHNAVRHATATSVRVRVQADHDTVRVEVEDDGRGIDGVGGSGLGLRSMRERATELGGRLELLERPGGGTVVRAVMPLAAPGSAS